MSDAFEDVGRTIEFRTDAALRRSLPWALALTAVGFAMLAFPTSRGTFGGWLVLAVGICWIFTGLARVTQPSKPVLVLSPQGVRFRIPLAVEALIPWTEIKRIETVDLPVRVWHGSFGSMQTIPDITVLLVSRAFYDTHLHVPNPLVRGPGWRNVFTPRKDVMQIALHHGPLSVTPRDLRRALQVRWEAYRASHAAPGITSMTEPPATPIRTKFRWR